MEEDMKCNMCKGVGHLPEMLIFLPTAPKEPTAKCPVCNGTGTVKRDLDSEQK